MPVPSPINTALGKIPKRAESRAEAELRATFEDSGVALALDTVDHQVVYGRRGTGKTHALRYLASTRNEAGDIAIYVDLRTIGSAEGVFDGQQLDTVERTGRLLIDLLNQLHDEVLRAALDDSALVGDSQFVGRLDSLLEAIGTVRVVGEVERTTDNASTQSATGKVGIKASLKSPDLSLSAEASDTSASRACFLTP